ncbi:hypothetical protein [Moritella sp. Urea-trap-13]|uniref:hypothetical protein n=1 Tax=Moritella sp. Urea-trap-13 TaxID=2058327 RepID=UPI000C325FA8|nr:hypothetical protein [Moritella sp. Urea-trap-13]PKH06235.1 hypothetical protein CXF93_09925 [Moritella sp. Urea-trap-13]
MNGLKHYKRIRVQLLLMPFLLLYGCATAPADMSLQMAGMTAITPIDSADKPVVEPRKLNFAFEYKQVALTKGQRNRLLYLYDWRHGAIISYGKAKADNDYTALSIGHQRVQSIVQALTKNQQVIQVNFDPLLDLDSVLIEEKLPENRALTTKKAIDVLESARL